jgi:outer membrane usher protein
MVADAERSVRQLVAGRWLHPLAWLLLLCPAAAGAQDQRAVLELVVNEVPARESLVVLRGEDVLVGVDALREAGLQDFAGARSSVAGEDVVSLASLAPAVAFRVDERDLRLYLTADPALLGRRVRDLSSAAPSGLVYRADTSGFVNYAVNYHSQGIVDLFAESATTLGGALVYNTLSATDRSVTRGVTSVIVDDRQSLRRWTLGDSFAYSGALGGDAWVAGVSVSKEFAIDPYYVRFPTLALSTPIAVPSVMEVLVNGQVVSREQVAPGRIDVRNLPLTAGRNDAEVIVRDAFGTRQRLTANYYLTTTALARGVHEYQYSVGFRRNGIGEESWDYRTPVALGRHRVGLTDAVTAGGRVEAHPGRLVSGGPSLNLRLPVGEVEAAASVSRSRGEWGGASLLGFSYAGRPVSGGASVTVSSRRHATLSTSDLRPEPAAQVHAYTSVGVTRALTMTLQHDMQKLHAAVTRSRTSLLSTVRLAPRVQLGASVSRSRDETGRGHEAYAALTVLFGGGTASVAHVRDRRGQRMAVDAQRSLPLGEGYGYQVRTDSTGTAQGVAQYQGRYGRYEVRQESIAGQTATTLSAAGSIVAIGGGVYASRPIQGSYALVEVPGVEGVRAYASNQEVGRTGRTGALLVPDLQAYYGNRLDIADTDVPLTYAVPRASVTLAPPYRGGAVARFPVRELRQVVGRVRLVEGFDERTPAYGAMRVTVSGTTLESPLGTNGNFYFENLPPGQHVAVVEHVGATCSFVLDVPSVSEPITNVGTQQCRVAAGR